MPCAVHVFIGQNHTVTLFLYALRFFTKRIMGTLIYLFTVRPMNAVQDFEKLMGNVQVSIPNMQYIPLQGSL